MTETTNKSSREISTMEISILCHIFPNMAPTLALYYAMSPIYEAGGYQKYARDNIMLISLQMALNGLFMISVIAISCHL